MVARETNNQDLMEVLEQQAATNAILDVISESPGNLQPVFDMIARGAKKLCHARFSSVFQFDGKFLYLVAHYGIPPSLIGSYRREFPKAPSRETAIGRAILSSGVVHILDVKKDHEYAGSLVSILNYRSVVAVPMLHSGEPVGGIVALRLVGQPFPERKIRLLRTFAVEAGIAIENTRLLQEFQVSNQIQEKAQIFYWKPVTKSKRKTQGQTIDNSPYATPRSSFELGEVVLETKFDALNICHRIFLFFIGIGAISTVILFLWVVALFIYCLAWCSGYLSSGDLFDS